MAGKAQFTAAKFIAAIPGTGGIVSALADRVGCDWHTAKRYIEEYATVRQAWDAERERVVDKAEFVMIAVIDDARRRVSEAMQQKQPFPPIDTADIKWFLAMKGKDRGYVKTEAHEHTGAGGGPIETVVLRPIRADVGDGD